MTHKPSINKLLYVTNASSNNGGQPASVIKSSPASRWLSTLNCAAHASFITCPSITVCSLVLSCLLLCCLSVWLPLSCSHSETAFHSLPLSWGSSATLSSAFHNPLAWPQQQHFHKDQLTLQAEPKSNAPLLPNPSPPHTCPGYLSLRDHAGPELGMLSSLLQTLAGSTSF